MNVNFSLVDDFTLYRTAVICNRQAVDLNSVNCHPSLTIESTN